MLREAIALGVNHVDTSDYCGPHITNQLIREALHPYQQALTIATKIGATRGTDGSAGTRPRPSSLGERNRSIARA
ncbi:oxidoreductase [Xanthomonas arboricola pv. juglandis]|nr:oxidoreductase [Xanthomonas arboricola pv. juglandis]SYZ59251.1 oxidoreductase [Xanthomonas arboricola pv. juglandis]